MVDRLMVWVWSKPGMRSTADFIRSKVMKSIRASVPNSSRNALTTGDVSTMSPMELNLAIRNLGCCTM